MRAVLRLVTNLLTLASLLLHALLGCAWCHACPYRFECVAPSESVSSDHDCGHHEHGDESVCGEAVECGCTPGSCPCTPGQPCEHEECCQHCHYVPATSAELPTPDSSLVAVAADVSSPPAIRGGTLDGQLHSGDPLPPYARLSTQVWLL